MTTEKELKQRCTPEIIKRMVELAEGFEFIQDSKGDINLCHIKAPDGFKTYFGSIKDKEYTLNFSTLIHRAVEGWNKKDIEYQIRIDGDEVYIPMWEQGESSCKFFKKSSDYQKESLTQLECAMLDCLLDIFSGNRKSEIEMNGGIG